jgi:hypothetical protein
MTRDMADRMRERAALLGGTLRAGPLIPHVFRAFASLPLESAAPRPRPSRSMSCSSTISRSYAPSCSAQADHVAESFQRGLRVITHGKSGNATTKLERGTSAPSSSSSWTSSAASSATPRSTSERQCGAGPVRGRRGSYRTTAGPRQPDSRNVDSIQR